MVSESPKWVALILSLIAIVISGFSWWEGHRSRLVSEQINRPILITKNAKITDTSWGLLNYKGETDDVLIAFDIGLTNVGKLPASITKIKVSSNIFNGDEDCKIREQPEFGEYLSPNEMIPGFDGYLSETAVLSRACEKNRSVVLLVSVYIDYTDISGRPYSQSFMESLKVSPSSEQQKRKAGK